MILERHLANPREHQKNAQSSQDNHILHLALISRNSGTYHLKVAVGFLNSG